MIRTFAIRFAVLLLFIAIPARIGAQPRSHPALRQAPPPVDRPLAKGPGYFVDVVKGDDKNDGKSTTPWKTIAHAVKQLTAGDTLYLKGGVYYENVYAALHAKSDAPITIRSAPREQAIIDGSFRDFIENPADAWEPVADSKIGEYRSKRSYPNLRDVLGSFGDSMIGLQTYYHAKDMRSTNELVDWEDWSKTDQSDIKPLYCGPGMWYDPASGRIHIRLAHTNLPEPMPNYKGETDPRKLPLIIAPFSSIPLKIDGGKHLRFEDLIVRGAGYTAVELNHGADIAFDNVTVWCGAYGMQVSRTVDFKFLRSGLYGNVAPWTFRSDGSKRDYPGRPHRNISRLNTHALLEIDSGRESSVYATPQNDRWEIAYSNFSDAHDGLYLGAINVQFHHNVIENLQDDGIYLSPMYHRHRLDKKDPEIHIYQNYFGGMLTALAFGGTESETRDKVFIFRNIFDLRSPVNTGRPTTKKAEAGASFGKVIGDHGSPPWSAMNIYHNTFIAQEASRDVAMATLGGSKAGNPRRVFNNIYLHLDRLPAYVPPSAMSNAVEDGNLYWALRADAKSAAAPFARYRASPEFAESKKLYPAGSSSNSLAAPPRFMTMDPVDFRLTKASPAIDAGVPIPETWPDPLRDRDKGKPDIGALPLDGEKPQYGRTVK